MRRLTAPFMLLRAVLGAMRLLHRLKPRCVLSFGGFAAGPGGLAAWLLRRPLLLHESNRAPGLTNRLLARFARRRLVGMPGTFTREELVGKPESGILASGAIVSLMDTCSGAAVWMAMGRFQPIVTIDLRLDYYRPALKGETVIARCHCDKLTRQIAFVSGVAHTGDPERPVARATGSFMLNP